MLNDLYSDRLLAAAASLPPARRLAAPDGSGRRVSRVCGSEIELDVGVGEGCIAEIGLVVKACAIGQAAAGLFHQTAIGAGADDIFALRGAIHAMLFEGGAPPDGRFESLAALAPIANYPQRRASAMLVFEAACDALRAAGLSPGAAPLSDRS